MLLIKQEVGCLVCLYYLKSLNTIIDRGDKIRGTPKMQVGQDWWPCLSGLPVHIAKCKGGKKVKGEPKDSWTSLERSILCLMLFKSQKPLMPLLFLPCLYKFTW